MTGYTPSSIPGVGSSSREQYIKNPVVAWTAFVVSAIITVVLVVATVVAYAVHSFWFVVLGIAAVYTGWIAVTVVYGWLRSLR